jgi:hypothetical protein
MVAVLIPRRDGELRLVVIDGQRGDTIASRVLTFPRRAVPRGVVDSIKASLTTIQRSSPEVRDLYAKMELAKLFPGFRGFLVGSDETIWVEDYPAGASAPHWKFYSRNGVYAGSINLPTGHVLRAASRQRLWATVRDVDGLESLVRFSVGK